MSRPDDFLPMSDEMLAFLRQIKEEPDDDTHRLVFADWLEEQDDPRGELMRIQVEESFLATGSPQDARSARREREVLRMMEQWLQPYPSWLVQWQAELGLLRAWFDPNHYGTGFTDHQTSQWRYWPWISALRMDSARVNREGEGTAGGTFPGTAELSNLNELEVHDYMLTPSVISELMASEGLRNLITLELSKCVLGVGEVWEICHSPHLKSLSALDLSRNSVGDKGLTYLCESPLSAQLDVLILAKTEISGVGAQVLAQAPELRMLAVLDLSQNDIEREGAEALVTSRFLENLEELNLRGNRIPNETKALLRERFEPQCHTLVL